ncbi:putative reverse transcriptase domain-containing protein [Tanacetum coccineum]|uniref:Reverse transcriptase domain-containing protein n=1 Tax=Tanacetum coccineum TaxID=301880 RepID=A0ABQ4XU92_9ASTR
MSTAYHPQADGQSECMIQTLEDIMRSCVINFGGSYHSSIWCAPFEDLYGRKCKLPVLWAEFGESNLIGLQLVQETTDKVVVIKEKLQAARDCQKSYADNRLKPLELEVGDHVLLKVSPWKGVIHFGKRGKLAPRLPEELSGVHNTFHVSNLKKCLAYASLHVPLDEIKVDKTLRFVEEPVKIMDREVKRLKRSRILLVKVSDLIVTPEVGAVSIVSPSGVDDESEPTEERPVSSSHYTLVPLSEFPLTPVVAPPGIRRHSAILVRPSEAIPFGRPYRTHPNGSRKLLTARKRVRPLPARRLAWRRVSNHSSDRHSSLDSSSNSAPSDHSLSGHTPPNTTDANSSTPQRFVYRSLARTPRHSSSSERSLDSSSPSSRLSRKRCRSHTASVPSPTYVSNRSIAPTPDGSFTTSQRGFRDLYSTLDSGEWSIIEVWGFEIAASDVKENDEEFKAKASVVDTRKIAVDPLVINDSSESSRGGIPDLEDTIYDIVYYMSKVRIDRITKIETTQRQSHTASVPLPTHDSRSIAPTPTDLLPPCKRFKDSYSPKDSGEEHMEVDIANAEAVAYVGISDGVVAHTEDSVSMRVEIAASDVREDDEEFKAEARLLRLTTQRQLETSQLVASKERASLVERIESLRLEYLKEEFCQVRRDRDDTRRRLRRLESYVERHLEEALAAHDATHAVNAHEAENQSQNGSDGDNGNGGNGVGEARGKAYVLGRGDANPNLNVVKGMFLLNNHYAFILFDSGADRSFISTTFSTLLDITPDTLDVSYAVELTDGRNSETNNVLRGCTLGLLGRSFNIDLMPVELGSFDAFIGIDWLANHHAVIVCDEKVMRITYGDKVLIVHGDGGSRREKLKLSNISCTITHKYVEKGCLIFLAQVTKKETGDKSEEKRLEDVQTVRDFPEVFPEDLPGLPPTRQVEFQIDLVPGATPVARAPYRLAPLELQELSTQLQELSDKGFIRPSSSP